LHQMADWRPIFVVGAARSGTTLLQSMIDAHPDIALVGELHFFDQVMRLRESIPEPLGPETIESLRAGVLKCHAMQFVPEIELALEHALARLTTLPAPGYRELFRLLLEAFGELRGASNVGEKTPNNVRYLDELVHFFPHARIVHILRDPRDSISSRLRYPYTSPSVIFNTLLWKIEMIYAADFVASGQATADRYLEVRYEDLVEDPRQVLEQICGFIGVDFAPSMLEGHQRVDRVFKDEPWKDGVASPTNRRSVGAWRQRLTPAQAALIEAVAGSYLAGTGYDRMASVGRLRLLAEALRDAARYVPYKLRERWQAKRDMQAGTSIGSESAKINAMLLRALR